MNKSWGYSPGNPSVTRIYSQNGSPSLRIQIIVLFPNCSILCLFTTETEILMDCFLFYHGCKVQQGQLHNCFLKHTILRKMDTIPLLSLSPVGICKVSISWCEIGYIWLCLSNLWLTKCLLCLAIKLLGNSCGSHTKTKNIWALLIYINSCENNDMKNEHHL